MATVELTSTGDCAGIYNVATVAPMRGRGIGSAMTFAALREARTSGNRLAILQAADAGIGVYHRAGFVDYGRCVEYKPAGRVP